MSDFAVDKGQDTLGLIGAVVANHLLLRVLGDGGMGCVYEGEHEILKERRAIKVCKVLASRTAKERAVNEARMMARLQHSGICRLYDVQWGPPDGSSPVMVMELLQGHTFFDEVANGPIAWQRVVQVACDVLDALDYAHQQGIIHRDIKPENVFIATSGSRQVTKVMDFGIAKLSGISATKTGMQMGTPHYMSPEQCTNAKSVDARADVYSVAAMLYRGVTGQYVFPKSTAFEVISGHLNESPLPVRSLVPTVPDHVAMAIHRGLAKSREQRFASAAQMRELLLQCLAAGDQAMKASAQMPTLSPVPAPIPVAVESEETKRSIMGVVEAPAGPSSRTVPTVQQGQSNQPGISSTHRERLAEDRLRSFVTAPHRGPRAGMMVALVGGAALIVGVAVWAVMRTPTTPAQQTPTTAPVIAQPSEAPVAAVAPPAEGVPTVRPPAEEPRRAAAKRSENPARLQKPKKIPTTAKQPHEGRDGIMTGLFDD